MIAALRFCTVKNQEAAWALPGKLVPQPLLLEARFCVVTGQFLATIPGFRIGGIAMHVGRYFIVSLLFIAVPAHSEGFLQKTINQAPKPPNPAKSPAANFDDAKKDLHDAMHAAPPPPTAKQVEKALEPPKVTPSVRPDEPLNPVTAKVEKGDQSATVTPSVTAAPPAISISGNGFIATTTNNVSKTIQDAKSQAEDAGLKVAEFPVTAAKAALDIIGSAAKKAIEDIVAAAKTALETQIDILWEKYKWKVFAAGGALFAILMLPALVAAWLVRRIGRRRERRMQTALDQTMKLLQVYANKAGVKVPA